MNWRYGKHLTNAISYNSNYPWMEFHEHLFKDTLTNRISRVKGSATISCVIVNLNSSKDYLI